MKLAYLAGALVAIVSAYVRCIDKNNEIALAMRPLCNVALLTVAVTGCTFAIARFSGADYVAWLRDAAPYLLAASVPFLATDASREPHARDVAMALFVAIGILAAASFFVEWADSRRGLANLPLERILFPTIAPAVALFFYASARTLFSERLTLAWLFLAILMIPAVQLLTATRSSAALLIGPITLLVLQRGLMHRASVRILAFVATSVILALILLPVLSGTIDFTRLSSRLETVSTLLKDPNSDQSYAARVAQTDATWKQFLHNPLTGTGPGVPIRWTKPFPTPEGIVQVDRFTVDTGAIWLLVSKLIRTRAWGYGLTLTKSLQERPRSQYVCVYTLSSHSLSISL